MKKYYADTYISLSRQTIVLIYFKELSTMYACICHRITEKELEETVKMSNGNVKEAMRKLSLGESCGICLIDALEKVGMQIASKDSTLAKNNNSN